MLSFNPYLNFPGTAEDAFNFYKSVFGGDFINLQRFKDVPGEGKASTAEAGNQADGEKIMHIALPIGNGTILMASDSLESMGQKVVEGNNFFLCISAETEPEADTVFGKLSEGGKVMMPMQKTFWGSYFGMFTDKFGIQWMIDCRSQQA